MPTDTMSWMSEIPGIQSLPLWNICLPATHDTGTYDLTNTLTQDLSQDEQEIVNYLNGVVKEIESIQQNAAYTCIADPQTWVYETVIPAIKGIMTANGNPVWQQLADGVRCLDLRLYADPSGQIYTYHTLVGSPLAGVLSDLASFLTNSRAEIVYVTLGHLRNFTAKNLTDLCLQVRSYLQDFAYAPQQGSTDNPFDQTYEQIVTLNGTAAPRSRVILVLGVDTPPDALFWPMAYSPVDNDQPGQHIVSGLYADTDGLGNMISDQSYKFQTRPQGAPFALFQILTPQSNQVLYGLMSLLYTAFTQLGKSILSIEPTLGRAFIDYANTSLSGPVPEYMSLQQISQLAGANLMPMVYGNLLNGMTGANPLSFLYVDFYEVTSAVDIAINLTSGGLSGSLKTATEAASVVR